MSSDSPILEVALKLHGYIQDHHWQEGAISGPDPGVRFNARIGRFVKSYLSGISWNDDMTYLQGQSYWIMANWRLADITDGPFEEIALAGTEFIRDAQRQDGAWDYPNPEWQGRVATVEGCFAALALTDTYRRTSREDFLDAAISWFSYMETEVGYRDGGGVNYFAHQATEGTGSGVPNNSTLALWMMAELADVTREGKYLEKAPRLVSWLADVQEEDGELPYLIKADGTVKRHFLCFNYNAFQFLDLVRYHELTQDTKIWPVMVKLAGFLRKGVAPSGASRFECNEANPTVLYYTAALARAMSEATRLGLADYRLEVDRALRWLFDHQLPDGSFQFYSTNNYGVLSDHRSYPRYLAMILHHTISESQRRTEPDSL